MEKATTFWDFWCGVFSEPDGTPSYSRVISAIFLLFMLLLDVIHYARTGLLPAPADLVAQATGGNAGYLINQVRRVFEGAGNASGKSQETAKL